MLRYFSSITLAIRSAKQLVLILGADKKSCWFKSRVSKMGSPLAKEAMMIYQVQACNTFLENIKISYLFYRLL